MYNFFFFFKSKYVKKLYLCAAKIGKAASIQAPKLGCGKRQWHKVNCVKRCIVHYSLQIHLYIHAKGTEFCVFKAHKYS